MRATLPPVRAVPAADVRAALAGTPTVAFLDDDPTGTQTVRDLPVLTSWTVQDVVWALRQRTAGFFVLTNTRSLGAADAAARDREVVTACLDAAEQEGVEITFGSRGDSTLRGHFPLETDTIAGVLTDRGRPVDGILLAPAYVDAGRVTVDGTHWVRTSDGFVPAADSEFARDATFGYACSYLPDWVEEMTAGRVPSGSVSTLSLADIREGSTGSLRARLGAVHDRQVVVADATEDDDLRAVALAVVESERGGRRFVYRIGPSFVRARVGQDAAAPISDAVLAGLVDRDRNGLVVVGSHVARTTRQLERLAARRPFTHVELDVAALLEGSPERQVAAAAERAVAALADSLVVLSTSRSRVAGADRDASLGYARRVSAALTDATGRVVAAHRPAFVVAKGGITSSDVATGALGIRRARVRGSLLPGIVSLWEPAEGAARGLPLVVFAGNVGDADGLADVVERLEGRG